MPVESLILSVAVIGVFAIFASVLYWGDRRTRTMSPAGDTEKIKRRSF
ncbi:hypothetical protein JQ628_14890 [Bradyrhizobium lablabi]|nr:hypothetical protein [Bradyrhizobium lablabi]MBR1122812.1 hypothetical protein [Bradyrhizobium lablabi]